MRGKSKIAAPASASAELEHSSRVFERARRLAGKLFGLDPDGAAISLRERDAVQARLAAIVEAAPLSLLVTDRELRVTYASPTWLAGLGLAADRVIGRSLYDIAPETFEPRRARFDRCLAGETLFSDRTAVPRPDGSISYVQGRAAPWRDAAGEVGGLIVIVHDITRMVEALDRTVRSEERLKLAAEIAKLQVWEFDLLNHEFAQEAASTSLLGTQADERLAASIWNSIDQRDRSAVIAAWRQFKADGTPFEPEYRVNRNDGREVWAAASVRLVSDPEGKPLRFVGAVQDITARKIQEHALIEAKEEAEAANRAKSLFLATMSHEIRTPLNGLLGMVQVMSMEELEPAQRERLEVVRRSGEGLLAILNEVLDLSKIEAGKLTLEDGDIDICELSEGAHATFRAVAENKGLGFSLKVLPAARGLYRGDPMRVRQIIDNLVSNALKFTHEGSVQMVVSRRCELLHIRVSDTGIGIGAEQQKHLFRAFEQAATSMTRLYGGTGLGLAICRDLVDLMHGRIAVSSTVGKGTTFSVSLPLPKRDGPPRHVAKTARPAPEPEVLERPLRVLAAEDNSVNQLVLKTMLSQFGVEPVMVSDGRAAVEAWAREPWDMILMDVQMPVMDGPAATAEIRAREIAEGRRRTPIVALTANAMEDQISAYLAAGMDGHVAKPIAASRLFAALQETLSGDERRGAEAA